MKVVADGLAMLTLPMFPFASGNLIHPTLIWDDVTAILVDTGLPTQAPMIGADMEKYGVPLARLERVIITHHDPDHLGGLTGILRTAPHKIEVLAHAAEKPYIQGDSPPSYDTPDKRARDAEILAAMPEERRRAVLAAMADLKAAVDATIADGEELPYCGGIIGIHTPGHTPGHLSLYHKKSKTLIAGDALINKDDRLYGPDPEHTRDQALAIESLAKLGRYEIEAVICCHGGVYRGDIGDRLAELAEGR